MDRKDIWAFPKTMEAFRIFVRGLSSLKHLLVTLSSIFPAEITDFYRKLADFYVLCACAYPWYPLWTFTRTT